MITPEQIKTMVAEYFGVQENNLLSKCRKRIYVEPRQVAIALTKRFTSETLVGMGKTYRMDHTSVGYSIRNVYKMVHSQQEPFYSAWAALTTVITEDLKTRQERDAEAINLIEKQALIDEVESWKRFAVRKEREAVALRYELSAANYELEQLKAGKVIDIYSNKSPYGVVSGGRN